MRKVMSLMLMISGLAIGCGDSDSDTKSTDNPSTAEDAGGGNGNGNNASNADPNGGNNNIPIPEDASAGGEVPPPYPMCDRAKATAALGSAGAKWAGDPPFTMAELEACLAKCAMPTFACIQEMCEKGKEFSDCITGEVGVCAAVGTNALCKTEWENLGCCVTEKKCDLTSQAGANACVSAGGPCATDLMTYQGCSSSCQQAAQDVCVGPATGGGTTGGGTGDPIDTDAAVPVGPGGGGGGTTMIPAALMNEALQSVISAR